MNKALYLQCDCCYGLYDKLINIITNQASDCASEFFLKNNTTFIYSYYGSNYDNLIFQVVSWVPPKECGVICDKCIIELINNKSIIEVHL